MGTLIGADLLNLGAIQGLGAPVASIGGAGTFDGIFLTAILAVLIAGLSPAVPSPDAVREMQSYAPPRDDNTRDPVGFRLLTRPGFCMVRRIRWGAR